MSELVKVKHKYQVTIPTSLRKQVGLAVGDVLEASVEEGKITLNPKTLLDRHLAEALEDIKKGRVHGPYKSVDAMLRALHRKAKTPSGRKKPTLR